ncbi:hypothetical protein LCGC14_1614760 [marine sediment metagenome]|uniref:Uncharacterized protein n=1 Tax=marine sediment metagenome TaxID=412755 RepID=A0A0F9I777_9ZZZZ
MELLGFIALFYIIVWSFVEKLPKLIGKINATP